jgi:uncharacterized protein DUF3987/uncharacterized protein DUF3854
MTEWGTPLEARDLEKLAQCGISPQLAESALLRRVDSASGAQIVGRNGSGNYAGIIFPYVWPGIQGAREYRLRRDEPDLEYKADGSIKEKDKYLSPPGRGNLLYLPPDVDPELLADPSMLVILCEGEKKCLALSALAWVGVGDAAERPQWLPIGLAGVWGFRGRVAKTAGPDGSRRDVKGVIPDFEKITWAERRVLILFDANVRTNDGVRAARNTLAWELTQRGAEVETLDLPEVAAVNGVDDLVGVWGADRVVEFINTAPRDTEWPEFIELQGALPPVEECSEEQLLSSVRPLAKSISYRMQAPIDFPAACAVVVLTGSTNRRLLIRPKRFDSDWREWAILWGGIVGMPGVMKSPILTTILKPLSKAQSTLRAQHKEDLKLHERNAEAAAIKLAAWKDAYKAELKRRGFHDEECTTDPTGSDADTPE